MAGSDICILFLTVSVIIVLEGLFHCLYKNKILSFLDASVLIRVPRGGSDWSLTKAKPSQNDYFLNFMGNTVSVRLFVYILCNYHSQNEAVVTSRAGVNLVI